MAEIRSIRENELEWAAELFNNAFRIGMEKARGWTSGLPLDETIAVVEKDRIASFVRMLKYRVWVGGSEMRMGGIGAVSTWADAQGHGFAGELMRRSVRIMRDRGDAVSALYPFSHRYYGKFGWASMGERIIYTEARQNDIIPHDEKSLVRRLKGEEDIELLDAAYREYAKRYNGMTIRPRERWVAILRSMQEQNGQIYLIIKDEKPIGYLHCEQILGKPGGHETVVRDFACVTQEAYRAMFGFLASLPTNVAKITAATPILPNLACYFKEPFITMKWALPFQYRVLDVERAVAARGYSPGAKGSLKIKIHDECGDWNTGAWEIEVEQGKGIARKTTGRKADIEMTIQDFSKLYMGALDAASLAAHGVLENISEKTLVKMNAFFHDHPAHLVDGF
ncbi:GNAT family N-acetyltransferase [Candidatus Sumerlaeota bacterium]|nr:GNAT family N-acetyltransferase [Candidatus Sumerlaeota bacterium]